MAETPTCATCRFFDPAKPFSGPSRTNGLCRANAPSAGSAKPWPVVQQTDWCGDHPDLQLLSAKDPVQAHD